MTLKRKYKIIRTLLVFLGLTILLTGCNNTIYPIYIPARAPKVPENAIVKDIPRYPRGKLYTFYILAKQKEKQLGLSAPENGYDSLLMRMWYTYPKGIYQFAELVEISLDSSKAYTAYYTKMRIFYNPSRRYEVINK